MLKVEKFLFITMTTFFLIIKKNGEKIQKNISEK